MSPGLFPSQLIGALGGASPVEVPAKIRARSTWCFIGSFRYSYQSAVYFVKSKSLPRDSLNLCAPSSRAFPVPG